MRPERLCPNKQKSKPSHGSSRFESVPSTGRFVKFVAFAQFVFHLLERPGSAGLRQDGRVPGGGYGPRSCASLCITKHS